MKYLALITILLVGGLLLGLGFVLGGLFGSTFWAQFLFIGIVAVMVYFIVRAVWGL